jgi:3-oxoacyl-[acyl-carrier protein] reductase/pteridine reductase
VTRPAEAAPFDLADKVVLVTGAARRIGRDIALRLHSAGARVAIHYSTSEDEARATASACGGAPVFRTNLESVAGIGRMFAEVGRRCGRIDALVNNAARFTRKNALEITEADWDYIHTVNLKACFFCAQQAARMMRAQGSGGRIVNISSLGGLQPWAEHVPYCASKAGVIMMTRALAKALAPDITVNSVAPGFIPYQDKDYTQTSEGMIRDTPVKRAGSGAEIADAVMFFLQSSNYITGQTIAVDGGLGLR